MSDKRIRIDVTSVAGNHQAHLPGVKVTTMEPQKKAITKAPFPKDSTGLGSGKWATWGNKDNLPTDIRQKLEKVPVASAAIYRLVAMMYGNGLSYYNNQDLKDGNTKVKRAYTQEIEDWLDRNYIRDRYLVAQLTDYRMFFNCFSEMILSLDEKTITGLYHKPAEFCRLEKQNEKTLNIDFLYFSPDFGASQRPSANRMKKIPLFVWYEEDQFLEKLKGRKFAWHSKFETPSITYYAKPFSIGLFRENGWIDAAIAVPEVVNSMMRNQVVLKYQILIPETYFSIRYVEWDSYTDEQRKEAIDEVIQSINDSLVGTDNAFTSITTVFKQDPISGADVGKLEIIAIDDKVKKDEWVPSSTTADAQIVQGLGLHPSQVGLANEGGKMGAGSGSDQRESFNTGISLNTIDQRIVLSALNYVARFNARTNKAWDVTFFIDHTEHTTTNQQESGLKPSDNTIQVTE
ncbi:MAG TPA: hypothetical protein PK643_00355 [Saprospiraceae bacterium]|nr:hypothetical protein [Saprospiraceae bacterium]